ncbi:MAG TPA: phosphotransferase family protein [Thermoanaerobaculia bacterium]|jgi:aminoglycoside phosphotransferase (APT) family kinase protein|nr:phosphotransferase family protein [Thermoanaerobaculia bacterium]
MSDTRPVRGSENLAWERLAAYLRERLPLEGEMAVEQFPGGHSNLTYLLRFGNAQVVLRRPPFGPVPPRAHDMAREFRVLSAVHPHFPLAPRPLLLCEDTGVVGSVFYVMERRTGIVIRTKEPPEIEPLRAEISAAVVDTLADLHAIDVAANGLETLGKPAGFVARQIRGWTERWHGAKTSDVAEMEWLASWLEQHTPGDPPRPALVHGDYKLDNVMLDSADPRRLVGVFDWEMSAVGDPLVDVGIILCYWVHVASAEDDAISTVTNRPGWFTREQILDRYAGRSGANLNRIALYEVFAVFKLAVVIQQIYARFVRGQTDDPRFAPLGERVASLARIAADLAAKV